MGWSVPKYLGRNFDAGGPLLDCALTHDGDYFAHLSQGFRCSHIAS